MPDGAPYPPTGRKLATDEVTYSGETMDLSLGRLVKVTGSEGSKTVVEYNPSTEEKQDDTITAIAAVETAVAAVEAALGAQATAAKQDDAQTALDAIVASVAAAATEATLAAISAQLPAALSSGRLKVELDAAALSALETITVASISAAIPAGSNTIGAVDLTAAALAALETIQVGSIAAGDNNIGNVDVVTLPALPAGSNNIGTVELSATALAALETINAVTSGDVASGASDTGNPLSVGLRAATTNPTAVTDGQRVKAMGDAKGRFVTVGLVPRGLSGRQGTTVSNTTNETTIVTAVASTYLDLKKLVLTNGGNVATRVDVRDDTGGSVQFSVWLAANGGGVVLTFEQPLEQTAQNKNWTVQCSAAVTDLRVLAQFVKNT